MSAPSAAAQPPGPINVKGPRGAILLELKRSGRATARDLARSLDLSMNAVRHHLKELESEALVHYEREHRGVGAPVFVFFLAPAADALFPRRYRETLEQLLDYVAARDGRAAAASALESHFDAMAERLRSEVDGAPPAVRMAAVVRALSDAGYMAEGEATFCCGTLTERNCAIREVAERFPEVCAAEERFLASVLGGTVERRSHMLQGCGGCEYKVRFPQENV